MTARRFVSIGALGALALAACPGMAQAQDGPPPLPPSVPYMPLPVGDYEGAPHAAPPPAYAAPAYDDARYREERERWLAECRRRASDNGVGGAVIGGLVGGVAGNRIAGKHNRTVGTVAGAAVGAVAGAAIDKAEDRGRARDACEDYLANYGHGTYGQSPAGAYPYYYPVPGSYPAYGYPPHGPGYGYPPIMPPAGYSYGYGPVMLVPTWVPVPPRYGKRVREEVVEDRVQPRRAPDKRVRIAPDKRTKYVK
jgi:uncharacterized protein YcfJ